MTAAALALALVAAALFRVVVPRVPGAHPRPGGDASRRPRPGRARARRSPSRSCSPRPTRSRSSRRASRTCSARRASRTFRSRSAATGAGIARRRWRARPGRGASAWSSSRPGAERPRSSTTSCATRRRTSSSSPTPTRASSRARSRPSRAPSATRRVGAACGRLVFERGAGARETPESEFWDRETRMKEAEGALGVCLGANGGIYAARRALVRPLPEDTTSMDDFLIPVRVARDGHRIVFAGDAVAREDAARDVAAEVARRVRIGIGAGQVLRRERWLYAAGAHPLLTLAFLSRKAARWLAPLLGAARGGRRALFAGARAAGRGRARRRRPPARRRAREAAAGRRRREALLFRRVERRARARRGGGARRLRASGLDADGALLMARRRPSAFRIGRARGRSGDRGRGAVRRLLPPHARRDSRARSACCRPAACASRSGTSSSWRRCRRWRSGSSVSTATTSGSGSRWRGCCCRRSCSSSLTLASVYFLAQPYSFPRSVLVIFLLVNGVGLSLWRTALDRVFPQPRRRALIVGGGPAATLIADTIRRHSWTGVELAGLVGAGDGAPPDVPVLGPVEDLLAIVEAQRDRRGHPDARGGLVARRDPGAHPAGVAGGPARLAVAVRDDDRAPAFPDRRRPAAARGAGAPARRRRRVPQARLRRRRLRGRAAPAGAGARPRGRARRGHLAGGRLLPADAGGPRRPARSSSGSCAR